MLIVSKENIKDYLDWIKTILTICSAAVAALVYKFDGTSVTPTPVKAAAVFFVLALVFFTVAYTGLIEHKDSESSKMRSIASIPLMLAYAAFHLAFGALVVQLLG